MLKNDYSIRLLCDLLAISRSSSFHRSAESDEKEHRWGTWRQRNSRRSGESNKKPLRPQEKKS
jgi:hypothetical protein